MRIIIMFFLFHILSMCMNSCTYILKNKTHEPCKFYPDELLVLGDDMNATNINSFTFNATRTMMNLMGLTFADFLVKNISLTKLLSAKIQLGQKR